MSALAIEPRGTPPSEIDLDVSKLKLDVVPKGKRLVGARIESAITDGELERTTDGASTLTLTLHDPKRTLLQSGLFSYAIDVSLDALRFRLAQVSKQGDDLTLTFEDRAVALLRQHSKPRHAPRGKITRAEFALSLVREIKHPPIPFVCSQLHVQQPIAGQLGKHDKRKARKALPYQFRRGGTDGSNEDSWTCLQRLASEVNWRCFARAGAVVFASDATLLSAKRKTVLSEQSIGVSAIDFEIDNGKISSEVTLSCRARRWATPPGDVVELRGVGPADGLWLVHAMRRSLFNADATITLRRATQPLAEPAPELAPAPSPSKRTSTKFTASGGGAPASVDRAWSAAASIDAKHYPYVWGGGHGSAGVPSGGGFDCSGSVCAVLAAAGLGFRPRGPVDTSGTLARSWGRAGEGQYLTVWANDVHTFVVFHTARGDVHFGTGSWGKSWGGAGFNPNMHPTSGFSPRHWPGT